MRNINELDLINKYLLVKNINNIYKNYYHHNNNKIKYQKYRVYFFHHEKRQNIVI